MSINHVRQYLSFSLTIAVVTIFVFFSLNPANAQEDVAANTTENTEISTLVAKADIERGKKKSMMCAACHTFKEGGRNMAGPNLWGVYGREKASLEDFSYSSAMKEKEGVWDDKSLYELLKKPTKYVPGTKMIFAGISKKEDRAALIAWLKTLQ